MPRPIPPFFFKPEHRLCDWSVFDHPAAAHRREFNCTCIDDVKYKIPVLSDEGGQVIPVQAYHVCMHSEHLERTCDDAILITHPGASIKLVPLSEIASEVDVVWLATIDSSLQKARLEAKTNDYYHFESLKKSIYFAHFSSLLRNFECANNDFISELQRFKTQLYAPTDLATANGLLEKLKSRSVVAEVSETVKKLAALKLMKVDKNRTPTFPSRENYGCPV